VKQATATRRLRLAIVGFGRLGRACVRDIADVPELALAGVIRRQADVLPRPFHQVEIAEHVRDLPAVDAALLCVPAGSTKGVALELLQSRVPIVECAQLGEHEWAAQSELLDTAARRHRVPCVIGAGWDPGVLPMLHCVFETLIPRGATVRTRHPGKNLHHSTAIESIPGVLEALTGEWPGPEGTMRRYVYLRLGEDADVDGVRTQITSDPLFSDEATEVFDLPDLGSLEAGEGMVLERRATAAAGEHQSLALDARFDAATFAARVMLDAARRLRALAPGAHLYTPGMGRSREALGHGAR
jgi:diaminopimelate dehydrogenase